MTTKDEDNSRNVNNDDSRNSDRNVSPHFEQYRICTLEILLFQLSIVGPYGTVILLCYLPRAGFMLFQDYNLIRTCKKFFFVQVEIKDNM